MPTPPPSPVGAHGGSEVGPVNHARHVQLLTEPDGVLQGGRGQAGEEVKDKAVRVCKIDGINDFEEALEISLSCLLFVTCPVIIIITNYPLNTYSILITSPSLVTNSLIITSHL